MPESNKLDDKLAKKIAAYDAALERHRQKHGNKWMTKEPVDPSPTKEWKENGNHYELFITHWGCDGKQWHFFPDKKTNPAAMQMERFVKEKPGRYTEVRSALFIDGVYSGDGNQFMKD